MKYRMIDEESWNSLYRYLDSKSETRMLASAVRAMPEVPDWTPAHIKPEKDGSYLIVDMGSVEQGYYSQGQWFDSVSERAKGVTWYMHLPDPPKEAI